MTQSTRRRLDRLESTMGTDVFDLATALKEGRRRILTMTPAELQREQDERLAKMRRRHAATPLRGLELRMLEGLERVCAPWLPEPAPSAPQQDEAG